MGAGALTSLNPASQPIYNAASGLTYPHACEGCMGVYSEEREAEVQARYAPEKEALLDRIEELRRVGPQPLLSEICFVSSPHYMAFFRVPTSPCGITPSSPHHTALFRVLPSLHGNALCPHLTIRYCFLSTTQIQNKT